MYIYVSVSVYLLVCICVKVCIAGAPVTDWMYYDTAYTERYLGIPPEANEVYKACSVLQYANRFPNK